MHKQPKQLSLALILAFAITLPRLAEANNFDHCPEIWSDYVELVRDLIASSEREILPVLFVGTSGQTYNCLNEDIDSHLLSQANSYSLSIAHLFEGDLDGPSSEWPATVCGFGNVQNPLFSYLTVGLPHTSKILSKEICRVRIENSLTRHINVEQQ